MVRHELGKWNLNELIKNPNRAIVDKKLANIESTAKKFEKMGLKDHQGRSFRKFDLNRRLFRYPCSFLIYSPNFAELPTEVLSHIFTRLDEILTGRDTSKDFRSLSDQDRNANPEILIETSPHAKKFWPTERF